MPLSLIAAVSENNAIGTKNALPWHLPADLRFFKKTTLGKPVLMGRKTYESLGKPLAGRDNIIISTSLDDSTLPEGVTVMTDLQQGIDKMLTEGNGDGFIIGGGQIFEATINLADRLYITRVHTKIDGADAFFPIIDHSHWKLAWEEEHGADEKHRFPFTFQQFERIDL